MTLARMSAHALCAIAGAALLASIGAAAPASAMPLPAPAGDAADVAAPVQQVWWDRWGRWHPNYYRWGYWRPAYYRHCWRGRWGYVHCGW